MEKERQEVVKMLGQLKEVKFTSPSKMEMYSDKTGLGRVQRKEEHRYKLEVEKQKVELTNKLAKLDKYLENKKKYDSFLDRRKEFINRENERINQARLNLNKQKRIGNKNMNGNHNVEMPKTFQEKVPTLLSRPNVVVGRMPIRGRVRMQQRRMIRRGY